MICNCHLTMFALFLKTSRPTFRRIIRNRSTEQFSGLPYIYALLNCLICLWYGTPLISNDNVMVVTVNSIGAVFQLAYIILFIVYAEKAIKVIYPFGLISSLIYCLGEWSFIFHVQCACRLGCLDCCWQFLAYLP